MPLKIKNKHIPIFINSCTLILRYLILLLQIPCPRPIHYYMGKELDITFIILIFFRSSRSSSLASPTPSSSFTSLIPKPSSSLSRLPLVVSAFTKMSSSQQQSVTTSESAASLQGLNSPVRPVRQRDKSCLPKRAQEVKVRITYCEF